VNEGIATSCQRLCTKMPDPIKNAVTKVDQCVPMRAGGFCPVTCDKGYWASGFLACDPNTLEWNLPTCDLRNYTFALQAHYSFQLTGVQANSKSELAAVTGSLTRALSRILGLSSHLMTLSLQAHAPSLPPLQSNGAMHLLMEAVAPPSTDFKAHLLIKCRRCEFVLRRLHVAGKNSRAFDSALSKGLCGDRCLALPGRPWVRRACLQDCPEAVAPFQTLYRRDPIIEQVTTP